MPFAFQKADLSPTCRFSQWMLIDEGSLVRTLAWLYLRKPKHAVQIINQLEPSKAGFPGKVFENAISLLSIRLADIASDLSSADPEKKKTAINKKNKRIEQRDGLLFQHLSWIAASIDMPTALATPPHVRRADKGFDGLIVSIEDAYGAISSVVLCEDKASINPKSLVQGSVWTEIDGIVKGDKDLELLDAITAILREQSGLKGDKQEELLDALIYERTRAFRVAVTVMPANAAAGGYQHIFNDFEKHAIGADTVRLAEVLPSGDTRSFLRILARKVRREIKRIAENV
ncbi:hypothetical protein M3484_08975 [Pseudomonas sp. GX19020]|uniref:hypothetical protein n=1 Tax=Pseudomonas sp. GX19020 TaxID=2942277 RepID=UPI00201967F4|nr:hypothetical protein [Pseudomonas sp. GX19020]MCL4066704.1 hypothetical protein [Pseudomonas sp. GX19020]